MSFTHEVKLGDVAEFIRGINFKPDDVVPLGTEGSVGCMRTKNVQDELDCSDVWAVPKEFVRREEQMLAEGDILVSSANSWNLVGKCSWIPRLQQPSSFGGFVSVLRAAPGKIEPRFLYRWFSWERTQALLRSFGQKTTNISNLNIERCLNMKLALPPLPEQRRIAAILDQADALRAKRREALAQLDRLTQSIFIEMFGDPASNPKQWNTKRLGDFCDVGSSKRVFVEELVTEGIPFYRGTEVGRLGEGLPIEPTLFIAPEHYEKLKAEAGAPNKGDLLLPSICPDGRIYIVRDEKPFYYKDARVLWIKVDKERIESVFLRHYLKRLFATDYSQIASGTTFAELKIFALKDVRIYAAPLDLQRRFAAIVGAIEEQIEKYRTQHTQLDNLFSSLQHRAFRGEL